MRQTSAVAMPQNINHLHPTELRWFAVNTGFKQEKQVLQLLERKGIQTFLPLTHFTRTYARKKRQVSIPLISCYIFVRITREQYLPVLETTGVIRFVYQRKDLIAIPEAEIDILKRVIGELQVVEVDTATLREGDAVEIIAGNLTGLRGTFLRQKGRKNLVITLQTLGIDLLMELDPAFVSKLNAGKGG